MADHVDIASVPLPSSDSSRKEALQALALDVQTMLGTWFPPSEGYRTHQYLVHTHSPATTGRRLQVYRLWVSRGMFWEFDVTLVERDESGHGVDVSLADASGMRFTELLWKMTLLAVVLPLGSLLYLAWSGRTGWDFFGYATATLLVVCMPALFGALWFLTRPLQRWASQRRAQRRAGALLPTLLKVLVAQTLKRKGLL